MPAEEGVAHILEEVGWIVPNDSQEEVSYDIVKFDRIANRQHVRFWRFASDQGAAERVEALDPQFNISAFITSASAGAGLTPGAADYLKAHIDQMLVEVQDASSEEQSRQLLAEIGLSVARIGELRAPGTAQLGVRTVRKVLAASKPRVPKT